MKSLNGKVVVITGAGSGIGRALALNAAGQGAKLALSDVDAPGLQETAALVLAATGQEVRSDKLDVRDRAAWAEYAASVAAEFGTVNCIINNAGIGLYGDVTDTSYEHYERVIDIDFWGVVYGTKEFLPHLIASGDGAVINISSLFGLMSFPGQSAYNAAKFAVRGFSESLRQEMLVAKHPVTVTCVHPGGIKTPIARNTEVISGDGPADGSHAELFEKYMARTTAEKAAEVILSGALKGRARVLVGLDAKILDLVVRVGGSGYQRLGAFASGAGMNKLSK